MTENKKLDLSEFGGLPQLDLSEFDTKPNEKPKDPSLTDRAAYGFKRMIGATRTALTDDPNQVGQILADQNAAAPRQSAAAQRMQQEIKPYQEADRKSVV